MDNNTDALEPVADSDGPDPTAAAVRGSLDGSDGRLVTGWAAAEPADAGHRLVQLWVDGQCVVEALADLFRDDLLAHGVGDGHHAFELALPPALCDGQVHVCEVRDSATQAPLRGSPLAVQTRLAETETPPVPDPGAVADQPMADTLVAPPATMSAPATAPAAAVLPQVTGRLDLCDGLGGHGWAAFTDGSSAPVQVHWLLDQTLGGHAMADLVRGDLVAARGGDGRHGFRITLPTQAFDGGWHSLSVRAVADGSELPGSPLRFRLRPLDRWQSAIDAGEAERRQLADAALGQLEAEAIDTLEPGLLPGLTRLVTWLQGLPPGRLLRRALALRSRLAASRFRLRLADASRADQLHARLTDLWGGDEPLQVDLLDAHKRLLQSLQLAAPRLPGANLALDFDLPATLLDGGVHSFWLRLPPDIPALGPLRLLLPSAQAAGARSGAADPLWDDTPGQRAALARLASTPVALTAVDKARLRLADFDIDAEIEANTDADRDGRAEASAVDADRRREQALEQLVQLRLDLAQALVQAGEWQQALDQVDAALAAQPDHLGALACGVRCLLAAGDDAAAAQRLQAALQLAPEAAELHSLADALQGRSRVHQVRTVAFYLPQFHPTADNNAWWGEGFTEWHNVGGATPLFDGHLQPRRPTSLGYYDLRLPEAVNAQFDLARRYGIDGFCYYYYWFEGRRILERPLDDLVAGRTGPFPFCVCWANEDWTRAWDGATGEVLAAQNHSPESDFAFIQDVAHLLRHPDYIRVDGKPMLLVYRADKLATPLATVQRWREWCREQGIGELHLCAVQSFGFHDPRPLGFDAAVEFPPHCLKDLYPHPPYLQEIKERPGTVTGFAGTVYDYQAFARAAIARQREPFPLHRAAMVAWDNSARRGKTAVIYDNFSVSTYSAWVLANARRAANEQTDALCFVNAWNEWAEGSVMEPDTLFGHEILESTRMAKRLANFDAGGTWWGAGQPQLPDERLTRRQPLVLVGHDALLHGAQINLLNMARTLKRALGMDLFILLIDGGDLLPEYERVAPTVVLGRDEAWRSRLQPLLRQWAARGANKAICNTVVTGDVAELLKQEGYRTIGLVHELPALIDTHGLQAQCWRMADKADAIVFASKVVANGFSRRYWPDQRKLLVAPQGIVFNRHHAEQQRKRAEVRVELALPDDCLIVLGCGWGDTRKGVDLFVQLAGELAQHRGPGGLAFVWVGGVDPALWPYLRTDAKRLGALDLLRVTGKTDDPGRFFIAADLFALTSREDPFPSVVMEAFDAGLPVLAFDGGGGYVDIVNDETGALVPYLDVGAMANAARSYLDDDLLRQRIGANNHRMCRDRFGYVPYLQKLMALLANVPAEQVAAGHLQRQGWIAEAPKPRISAIVPNYNYARYLELRLNTIIEQTLPPCEIIVLDDASTDSSVALIESMAARSPIPVVLVRSEQNSGNPFVQWSKGLERATGDLIWIAEADDYCEPTLLETLAPEFINQRVTMAWCDSFMVDEAGRGSGAQYKSYYADQYGSKWRNHFRMAGAALIDDCLFTENVVPNASAVLFRRNAVSFELAPLLKYRFSGDWWFWLMLARSGEVSYRAEPLNYHRRHAKSVMGDVLRSGQALLPETMGFFERLAAAVPDCVTARSADMALQRLEQLYAMFPALRLQAPRLSRHPDFHAQHAALDGALRRCIPSGTTTRAPLTLVLSTDALDANGTTTRLIGTLAARHRLQILLLPASPDVGPDGDALLASIGIPAGITTHVLQLPSPSAPAGDAQSLAPLLQSLAALLPPAARVVSHGLQAHCLLARLPDTAVAHWQLVANAEFDALLGLESELPGVDAVSLDQALLACDEARYLGADPPHSLARLAQRNRRALDRLLLAQAPLPKTSTQPALQRLSIVATACGVPPQTWPFVVRCLGEASRRANCKAELRVLAWGEDLAALQALDTGSDAPNIVLVHEAPAAMDGLADALLVWYADPAACEGLPPNITACTLPRVRLPWPAEQADWQVAVTTNLEHWLTTSVSLSAG